MALMGATAAHSTRSRRGVAAVVAAVHVTARRAGIDATRAQPQSRSLRRESTWYEFRDRRISLAVARLLMGRKIVP
jgi:hypothetical protein